MTFNTETAREHLAEAREHYEAFQESMRALGREVRQLDEWQWQRVDAYPGWDGTRDVGAGVDMVGWLDEIERFLDGQDEEDDSEPEASSDEWTPGAVADGMGSWVAPRDPGSHAHSESADAIRANRAERDELDIELARARRARGESLYAIATSSPHRAEAYDASRYVIEEIKKRLPVWKRERYADGDAGWVRGHELAAGDAPARSATAGRGAR